MFSIGKENVIDHTANTRNDLVRLHPPLQLQLIHQVRLRQVLHPHPIPVLVRSGSV